jgi:hypothetical protein
MRQDLRNAKVAATNATLARARATDKAETLRDTLKNQQPDSGKVVAYRAAIQVTPSTQPNIRKD